MKKTAESIAIKWSLCNCSDAYTSRGLVSPDCPWHSLAVEDAMKEYADHIAVETRNKCAKRATVKHIGAVACIDKQSILEVEIKTP